MNRATFLTAEARAHLQRRTRRAVALWLRSVRAEQSWSQAELARRAGLTQATMSNYENERRDMRFLDIVAIEEASGISLGGFLEGAKRAGVAA